MAEVEFIEALPGEPGTQGIAFDIIREGRITPLPPGFQQRGIQLFRRVGGPTAAEVAAASAAIVAEAARSSAEQTERVTLAEQQQREAVEAELAAEHLADDAARQAEEAGRPALLAAAAKAPSRGTASRSLRV